MKKQHITRVTLEEAEILSRTQSLTDWERLRNAPEPEWDPEEDFEIDWDSAVLVTPGPKKLLSLRLDADVVEYFKGTGKGYQTRINAVLRAYKDAQAKAR